MFRILDASNLLPLWVVLGVLGFFGLMIIIIIIVKRHFVSLQIKKDDIDEAEAVRQELDRYLVPIEDEEIQKAMSEDESIEDGSKK